MKLSRPVTRGLTWTAALFLLSGTAFAAGFSPFNDQPASPQSLPGDNLPPFGMLNGQGVIPPPPQLPEGLTPPGANAPPTSTADGPTLDEALAIAREAVRFCGASGYRVGASVVNSSGEARALIAADGASGSFVFVGTRKALAALEFGMPSADALELVTHDQAARARVTPAMFLEGGGVPLVRDGKIIGALGVSGSASAVIGQQDDICAKAAAAAFAGHSI